MELGIGRTIPKRWIQTMRPRDPRRLAKLEQEANAAPHDPRIQAELYKVETNDTETSLMSYFTGTSGSKKEPRRSRPF